MKYFTTVNDVKDINELVDDSLLLKKNPHRFSSLGKNKTLGLIFLNPSLRTRLSTQKAALNLGMNVMVMNMNEEGWALEFEDGTIMNGNTVEHIRDAAAVMGLYCDIIGIRCFPGLVSREEDEKEKVLLSFMKYSKVPVVSLESSTLHPLQSLADLVSIRETWTGKRKPKVVLTWAPHIKALPQAVPNSFCEWMRKAEVEFVITHPPGYELNEDFTRGTPILHSQQQALEGADYVYVKNWSSYQEYGKILCRDQEWMLTHEKLKCTNKARVMHCLPVRRNLEVLDEVLDAPYSLVLLQASNRLFAAQAVLKKILLSNGLSSMETSLHENEQIQFSK